MRFPANFFKNTFVFLAFFTIFIFAFNQLDETDVFYHIKTGEIIWQTGEIPKTDIFSYTASGAKWVPHEWLAEIIFFGVNKVFGFFGLMIFSGLLAVATFALVYLLLRREKVDFRVALLVILTLSFFSAFFWTARPQIFSYLCFSALLFSLAAFLKDGKKVWLFVIPGIMLFWANVNASFPLGILAIILLFLWESVKKIHPGKFGPPLASKRFRDLAVILLSSLIVPLLNPAGLDAYLYVYTVGPAVGYLQINEWQSILNFWRVSNFAAITILIGISFCFFLWQFWCKRKEPFSWIFLLGIFVSFFPFISIRHLAFWVIVAMLAVGFGLNHTRSFTGFLGRFQKPLGAVFFVSLCALAVFRIMTMPRFPWDAKDIPDTAVDFLKDKNVQGPIFNMYKEGMYLIYGLYPNEKVFIDGRSEIYPLEVLKDYHKILSVGDDWERLVDEKYKIECFFLPYYPEALWKSLQPLALKLNERKWTLIYFDDGAAIFVRPEGKNAALTETEYKHLNPFFNPQNVPEENAEEAAKELERLINTAPPRSPLVAKYAALFISSHPDLLGDALKIIIHNNNADE